MLPSSSFRPMFRNSKDTIISLWRSVDNQLTYQSAGCWTSIYPSSAHLLPESSTLLSDVRYGYSLWMEVLWSSSLCSEPWFRLLWGDVYTFFKKDAILRCMHLVPNTEDSLEESDGKLPLPSQIFHLLFFFSNSQIHKMGEEPSQSLSMTHQSTGHSAWPLKVLKETLLSFLVSLSFSFPSFSLFWVELLMMIWL